MSTVNSILEAATSHAIAGASEREIDAALTYEQIFVPALFDEWPPHLIAAADVQPGHRTLDIACGTGVLTRSLVDVVGEQPTPVGLDIDPGMLEVARRMTPSVRWHQGSAQRLPFDRASFDRVLCQFGLMFFPDRPGALGEMHRVLASGGQLSLAVWGSIDNNPGFREKVDILDACAGTEAGDALRAPFCLGDTGQLHRLVDGAGFTDVEVETLCGEARFASMCDFVKAEVCGWLPVMGVHLNEGEIEEVHERCARALARYEVRSGGALRLPVRAHIASGRKA